MLLSNPPVMRDVDLRLAVAYVPGCVCLLKVVLLEVLLMAADQVGVQGWYVCLCLVLWLDWHYQAKEAVIVDTSSVLCWVYFASVVNMHRVGVVAFGQMPVFALIVSVCWAGMCLYALASHLGIVPYNPSLKGLRVSLESTCVVVGCVAFCSWGAELRVLRFCRGALFALLCVLWLYGVDLRDGRADPFASKTLRTHTVVLFLPLLFTDLYVSGVFLVCVCTLVGYSFAQSPASGGEDNPRPAQDYSRLPAIPESGSPPPAAAGGESLDSLEQMFREARARKNGDLV